MPCVSLGYFSADLGQVNDDIRFTATPCLESSLEPLDRQLRGRDESEGWDACIIDYRKSERGQGRGWVNLLEGDVQYHQDFVLHSG